MERQKTLAGSVFFTSACLLLLIVVVLFDQSQAFTPRYRISFPAGLAATVSITEPSSEEEVADLGMREWPQQFKAQDSLWTEVVAEDATLTRYILEGSGTLTVVDQDNAVTSTDQIVKTGMLIEVSGGLATLEWKAETDMLLLTPTFEEGGLLAGIAAVCIILFGALLAGVGGG